MRHISLRYLCVFMHRVALTASSVPLWSVCEAAGAVSTCTHDPHTH